MKAKLNFIIDIIMFVLMGLLAGLGLLIKYVLLSGTERWLKFERNVELTYMGLDRHQWGTIHLWIAIALIALLILHIILHWNMIVCLYKKLMGNKTSRIVCGSVFSIITLLFVVFPFLIHVDVNEMATGRERFESLNRKGNHETNQITEKENLVAEKLPVQNTFEENKQKQEPKSEQHYIAEEVHDGHHHDIDSSIVVKGYNTLKEISDLYGIPCDYLKEKLSIPASISDTYKLGHLRKEYGIKMSDIELIIYNYLKSTKHEKDN
ncbi:MAG: DUF4405 domain-containing protein [Bacteroidales bacterium]